VSAVITLTRLAVSFVSTLGVAHFAASVRAAATGASDAAAGLAEHVKTLPNWSTSAALKTAYGYKDNLLLSSFAKEQSAFARGSLEVFLLNVPRGKFDFSFFAQAEGTHYFSETTANEDAKVWVRTEPGFRLGDTLKFGVPVTGYYYDQVFDVSDTEAERLVAELKVSGLIIAPTVRWDFHPAWWLEAQAIGQRKRYEDRANDGRVGEGNVRLGWVLGRKFEVVLAGGQRWRNFDRRVQYSPAGRELPDTNLKISEREGEARFEVTWDEAARWQSITRVSLLHYRDNGSGYFNHREEKIGQDVEWRSEPWLVRMGGSASRIDFAVQKVGLGINPPGRLKDEFAADLHVERELTKRWTVYGGYTWERSRSNETIASYTVNEGLLGVRWSWEK
jgi:hypothetical protein